MSLIAASAEALAEGKHAALADLHFLLTLDESIVNAAEKQTTKAQLLEGKFYLKTPFISNRSPPLSICLVLQLNLTTFQIFLFNRHSRKQNVNLLPTLHRYPWMDS